MIRFKHDEIGLNSTTAIARVGDAVLAVTRGKQFYPDIDPDKLRDAWQNYRVTYDQIAREVVILRHKESPTSLPSNILDTTIVVEEPNFRRTITAFAWLYGTSHIIGRLTILGMLNDELKHHLEQECNVIFQQIKPNEHIMSR
jgi:hypothetical protein